MNDIVHDIEVIENALINLTEGASDEKYAAMWSLEKLLLEKKDILSDFEKNEENTWQTNHFLIVYKSRQKQLLEWEPWKKF